MNKETAVKEFLERPIDGRTAVEKGIERLARIYTWPNNDIPDKDKHEFDALCEFVMFKEFVKKPFFKILHANLSDQIDNLYRHLLSSLKEEIPLLSYKETFLLFRLLRKEQTRRLLGSISCPPSTYNSIIESLENLDYDQFVSSFENFDDRRLFQVLWEIRYIMFGVKESWDGYDPSMQIDSSHFNEWTKDLYSYRQYFCDNRGNEELLIKKLVLEIVGFENKRPIRCPLYDVDMVESDKDILGNSLFDTQWNDLLLEFENNPYYPLTDNRSFIDDCETLARLILTHNVILHKDDVMKNYVVDSSEVYNQFINSDVYIYEGGDSKDLGRYILYYTSEMLYIYNKVEKNLDEDSKKVLKNYMSRYVEFIDSFISPSIPQENVGPEEKGVNSNSGCANINAIVLNVPRLSDKYRKEFCSFMATRCNECKRETIDYFLGWTDEIPRIVISKDNPLIWNSTRQLFIACFRFLYLKTDSKQRIPSEITKLLESSVFIYEKPRLLKSTFAIKLLLFIKNYLSFF